MADVHSIIIEVKADAAALQRSEAETKAALRRAEAEAKRASRELAADFQRSANVAFEAMKKSARDQAAAAQQKVAAEKAAARQVVASAREAARAQEEHARHVTMMVELRARERASAEAAAYRKTVAAAREAAREQEAAARQAASVVQRPPAPGSGGGIGVGGALGGSLAAYAAPAAAVAVAAATISKVAELSDGYQNLTNRIRSVTDSEQEAIRVREQLFEISQRTRVATEATAEVYSRLAAAAQGTGRSQAQMLAFTESLNKAVKLSGATAQEAQAGMIQLAQGLGAGALRGDELRSVLEQLPAVADVIAKGMGVTRGQLRKLGEEGKISADAVFAAFEQAKGSIDERFGKSVATVSDLMVVLRNEVQRSVGSLVEQSGILPVIADGFRALGEQVRKFADGVGQSIKMLQQLRSIAQMFGGGLADQEWFMNAATSNVGTGMALQEKAYEWVGGLFNDQTFNLVDEIRKQQEAIEAARVEAASKDQRVAELLWDQYTKSKEGDEALRKLRRGAAAAFGVVGDVVAEAKAFGKGRTDAEARADASRAAAAANQVRQAYESLRSSLDPVYAAELQLAAAEETLGKAMRAGLATKEQSAAIYGDLAAKLRDQLDPFAAAIRKIQEETAAVELDADAQRRAASVRQIVNDLRAKGVELGAAERAQLEAAVAAQDELNQRIGAQRALLDEIRGPQEAYASQMRAANDLAASGKISLEEYGAALAKLNPELAALGEGVAASLTEAAGMLDDIANGPGVAEAAEKVKKVREEVVDLNMKLAGALGSIAVDGVDKLVDALNGASVSVADFARSALIELEKLLIRMIAFQAIKASLGVTPGGLGATLANSLGFAAGTGSGGWVVPNNGRGTDGVPVHMRLSPGERVHVTPAGRAPEGGGGGGGGVTTVNVRSVIVDDRRAAEAELLSSTDFERAVLAVTTRNAGKLRAALP